MMYKWLQDFLSLARAPSGEKDHTLLFARLAILLFVIVLPFQHNALWKNLAQVGMLLSAMQLIRQQRLKADLRSPIDELEMIVDKENWPVPTYADMLFEL